MKYCKFVTHLKASISSTFTLKHKEEWTRAHGPSSLQHPHPLVYSVNVEPFPAGRGHVSIGSCLSGLCDALGFIPRTTQS